MKSWMKYSLCGLILLLVACVVILINQNQTLKQITEIDQVAISTHIETFQLESEKTDLLTEVKGTVFYHYDTEQQAHAQIVASFQIDPLDWGGVAFHFPADWLVTGIKSSYPEDQPSPPVEQNPVVILRSHDSESKWRTRIEIANNSISAEKHAGGNGFVVIDLVHIDKEAYPPLDFSVAIGSAIHNGTKIVGADFLDIRVQGVEERAE